MALSLVQEEADDFPLAREALKFVEDSPYREIPERRNASQAARGAGPHAPMYDHRSQASPRPAVFPTKEVIGVLAAIGAILGARLALFISIGCMFALGFINPDSASIFRMCVFGGFVVIPVCLLSARRNI